MHLVFHGGLSWIVENNGTERLSLSSCLPLPTRTTKAGIAPSPRCDVIHKFRRKMNSCYLYRVMISTIPKKKRTRNPVCSYLRKLISPYGFGWKGEDGVGRLKNETLINYYNTSGFMGSPTNDELLNQ